MTATSIAPARNQRQLRPCPRCGEDAAFEDHHEAGVTLVCMICGHSVHLAPDGAPYDPTPFREYIARHDGPRYPKGLRASRFQVYLSRRTDYGRGTVDWRLEPPPCYTTVVYFHPPSKKGGKWKIYSAEVRPSLPADLTEQDVVKLKQVLRDAVAEILGPDEVVQATCSWELEEWGSLARRMDV